MLRNQISAKSFTATFRGRFEYQSIWKSISLTYFAGQDAVSKKALNGKKLFYTPKMGFGP
jgi:hypothetical protein